MTSPLQLTAVLGFVGVIITLLFNAWMQRKAREEDRAHRRKTVAAALIAELEILRKCFDDNARHSKEAASAGVGSYFPSRTWVMVFPHLIKDIGILSPEAAKSTVEIYMSLETFFEKLLLFRADKSKEQRPGYIFFPAENMATLGGMNESLVEPIDTALIELRKLL